MSDDSTAENEVLACSAEGCDEPAVVTLFLRDQVGHFHDCARDAAALREWCDVVYSADLVDGECMAVFCTGNDMIWAPAHPSRPHPTTRLDARGGPVMSRYYDPTSKTAVVKVRWKIASALNRSEWTCWANLASWALGSGPLIDTSGNQDDARKTSACFTPGQDRCYCGKFTNPLSTPPAKPTQDTP